MRVVYSTSSCGSLWASVLAGLPQDAWSPALPTGSDGRGGDRKPAVNISAAKEAVKAAASSSSAASLVLPKRPGFQF